MEYSTYVSLNEQLLSSISGHSTEKSWRLEFMWELNNNLYFSPHKVKV
jgi:hypothetical protein